jgi:hypothetical protein
MRSVHALCLGLALGWLLLPGCGDDLRAALDGGADAGPEGDAPADVRAEDGGAGDEAGASDAGGGDGGAAEAGAGDAGVDDAAGGDDASGDDAAGGDAAAGDAAASSDGPTDGAVDGPIVDCPPYAPSGLQDRWTAIEGLTGSALRAALLDGIDDTTPLAYDAAKLALFGTGGIDVHGGLVECVYTGLAFTPAQLDQTNGFNTEHSWPQSEFPAAAGDAPKGDLHHLFPTEQKANSRRSNLPFGETDCVTTTCSWQQGGSELGPRIGGAELVFEVRPPRRGEIARAHFYFAVRYAAAIPAAEEEALRRWHRCDPPDAAERTRNDAIEARQGNRNPFVDRPEFVDAIPDY